MKGKDQGEVEGGGRESNGNEGGSESEVMAGVRRVRARGDGGNEGQCWKDYWEWVKGVGVLKGE